MAVISNVTLGTLSLSSVSVNAVKLPGTIKMIMGKELKQHPILERSLFVQDWQLNISGEILGASISADRATLEGYDNLTVITYTDGVHNGEYLIIPGSLRVNDSGRSVGQLITYSLILIQIQQ